jgi:prevent-host-death family protein
MKTMTALEAKNSFGKFLSSSQREPVLVTKNQQRVGALISMEDLENIARSYLPKEVHTRINNGEVELIDALMQQTVIDRRIEQSREEIKDGQGVEMDAGYFDRLRAHVNLVSPT